MLCSFYPGYKGWGCSDDHEATSEIDLLAATLLLCLSNLLFLPAVGLAIYRGFYTESFVYFANMVFSTVSLFWKLEFWMQSKIKSGDIDQSVSLFLICPHLEK